MSGSYRDSGDKGVAGHLKGLDIPPRALTSRGRHRGINASALIYMWCLAVRLQPPDRCLGSHIFMPDGPRSDMAARGSRRRQVGLPRKNFAKYFLISDVKISLRKR